MTFRIVISTLETFRILIFKLLLHYTHFSSVVCKLLYTKRNWLFSIIQVMMAFQLYKLHWFTTFSVVVGFVYQAPLYTATELLSLHDSRFTYILDFYINIYIPTRSIWTVCIHCLRFKSVAFPGLVNARQWQDVKHRTNTAIRTVLTLPSRGGCAV